MESVGYFSRAAGHFQEIGMKGYLSNAVGELGHALLKLDNATPLPPALPSTVLRDGVQDAVEDARRCVLAAGRKGAENNEWPILKLFGVIVVLSLSDESARLGEVGRAVLKLTKDVREDGDQAAGVGQRATYELMHLVALAKLMMSIGMLESRAKRLGRVAERDIAELEKRCGRMGILRSLESSAFEWLGVYLRRRWSVADDDEEA